MTLPRRLRNQTKPHQTNFIFLRWREEGGAGESSEELLDKVYWELLQEVPSFHMQTC